MAIVDKGSNGNKQQELLPSLTITLLPTGDVDVTGPLANKSLCLHMIARAIVLVDEFKVPVESTAKVM